MASIVIIAEKPSVAKEIAKVVGASSRVADGPCGWFEGNGYKVTWAFGHLVGLKSPEQMGFAKNEIPMYPERWETKILGKKGKSGKEEEDPIVQKQMKKIERLFSECSKIVVATDAGREGELIFRYIYEYLGCRKPFERLWISSLTDEAIREGMGCLRPGEDYENLSAAAHLRSQSDWLLGFNASRALRVHTGYKGNLALGRVQTPTLGMICTRYEENKNFVPVPYWVLNVKTSKDKTEFSVRSDKKYESEKEAIADLGKTLSGGTLKVVSAETKRVKTPPPLLFDLTALQRDANVKFGLTADETLRCAQSLYEKKFITYPRTGSRYIPDDVYKTIPSLLKRLSKDEVYGGIASSMLGKPLCRKSVDAKKVTDHHALLPTGQEPAGLNRDEWNVYRLILAQMLKAFGEYSVADVTNAVFDGSGVTYKAKGSVPVTPGWKAVDEAVPLSTKKDKKKDDDEDDEDTRLPSLNEGDVLPCLEGESVRKETKPKPIYTDSSLLGEMETCGKNIDDEAMREAMKDVGLGTPATRAAIIEGLIHHGYVERDKKKLLPTQTGLDIWNVVRGRRISDVQTTGEWERDLALVEHGGMKAGDFEKGILGFVGEVLDDLQKNCKPIASAIPDEPVRTCPVCGRPMKNQRYSVTCSEEDGGCGLKVNREIAGLALPASAIDALCTKGVTVVLKGFKSKTGKKFDAKLKVNPETKNIEFDFPKTPQMSGRVCPCCGRGLSDDGPKLDCECGFTLWKRQFGAMLTEENIDALLSGGKILVKGMVSKAGKKFDAYLQINKDEKKIDISFPPRPAGAGGFEKGKGKFKSKKK